MTTPIAEPRPVVELSGGERQRSRRRAHRPGDRMTHHRLAIADHLRVGAIGLRTRPLRAVLSALGIAIGIAAMVSVVGFSASGRADLQRTLDRLGTNLLVVSGSTQDGGSVPQLPAGAVGMIRRIGPVTDVAALTKLPADVHVYRNDRVPPQQTEGIVPYAADLDIPRTVGATIASGAWLNAAIAHYPGVVLGANAAARLGLPAVDPNVLLRIGNQWFAVIGILRPVPLVPDLDDAAFLGPDVAQRLLSSTGAPTTIYVRAADSQVMAVRAVLGPTADAAAPYDVLVSRPSDALAAKVAAERAVNGLLLGLGAVALLVGGVGVANTMVISVIERRSEIGLRRSLGATRAHIRTQFLTESLLLATLGGAGGAVLGAVLTAGYAQTQGWPPTVPAWILSAALAATVLVGGLAGLFPAIRAARLSPTEALTAI